MLGKCYKCETCSKVFVKIRLSQDKLATKQKLLRTGDMLNMLFFTNALQKYGQNPANVPKTKWILGGFDGGFENQNSISQKISSILSFPGF